MIMRKIKNIIALACAAFIVVCNLKYAHDGYVLFDCYRSFVTYSTYELKCKPNGTLVDCQDETEVCPEEGVS